MEPVLIGPADAGAGLALSSAAGWNQTLQDWLLFIAHGHVVGCRDEAGRLVATAAGLPYGGGLGWISMVLVAPEHRHHGVATGLMERCMIALRHAGVRPVLDATPAGAQVYRRMGFVPGFELERWESDRGRAAEFAARGCAGLAQPGWPPTAVAQPARQAGAAASRGEEASAGLSFEMNSGDPKLVTAGLGQLPAIAALDASVTGLGRCFLLGSFLSRPGTRAWLSRERDGFVIVRAGHRAAQVGPLVAPDEQRALALLRAALSGIEGPVFLDVPVRWAALTQWLSQCGFRRQRPFTRMALGEAVLQVPDRMFVLAGPEFG